VFDTSPGAACAAWRAAGRQPSSGSFQPSLSILAVTAEIADAAARPRAGSGLLLPDAIQLATARAGGAEAFLTSDRSLAGAEGPLPVLVLDELVGA
jgi:predicted nucleic acid-binding protein